MNRSIAYFILIVFVCVPGVVISQPGGGGPPDVPITGIEILIAAGGALGFRALLAKRNKK